MFVFFANVFSSKCFLRCRFVSKALFRSSVLCRLGKLVGCPVREAGVTLFFESIVALAPTRQRKTSFERKNKKCFNTIGLQKGIHFKKNVET